MTRLTDAKSNVTAYGYDPSTGDLNSITYPDQTVDKGVLGVQTQVYKIGHAVGQLS